MGKDEMNEQINENNEMGNDNNFNDEPDFEEEDFEDSESNKINELETQVKELQDKLLRKAAEFENYKRRTENDQLNIIKYAAEPFIRNLLTVVDDFERSLEHMDQAKDIEKVKEGVKLIYGKLMKIMKEQGVEKIDAVGEPFDVDFHEAMMRREDDSVPAHTVLDEIEKGYKYKDRVIRHAKVIVSDTSENED